MFFQVDLMFSKWHITEELTDLSFHSMNNRLCNTIRCTVLSPLLDYSEAYNHASSLEGFDLRFISLFG
jgi:hypothetical protein